MICDFQASDREFSIFPSLQRAPPMLTMRPTAPPPLIPTPRMVPTLQPIGLRMPPRMAIRSTTPPLAPAVAPRALQLAPTVRPAPVQGGRQVREVRSSVNDVVNDVVQRSKGSAEETSALAERLRQPPQLNVIPSSKVAVPSSSVPRPIAPAPLKNSQKRTIGLACDTCGESMTSPAALKVHVLRHFPNAKV